MSLKPLSSEQVFNTAARFERLNTVRENLKLNPIPTAISPESVATRATAGIEIEMTWDQAFRDMQARWLNSLDRPIEYPKSSPTYQDFKTEYARNDRLLRPVLESVTPAIPRVGFDSYWEFSFNPTKDSAVADAELTTLYEAEILFEDIAYPTHMTIAGIPTQRDAAAILCLLEQSGGSTPERIESAIKSNKGSWAQKGSGGLRHRSSWELMGDDTTAYEFRTLVTTSPEQMDRLFRFGQELAHLCLNEPALWLQTRSRVEDRLTSNGLPLAFWGWPKANEEIWRKYGNAVLGNNGTQKESA